MAIYALLIGINAYLNDTIHSLKGCENDVKRIQHTLQTRFSVPEANIQTLTNVQATKNNIVNGFQTHLSQAGKNDTALFYFSGQGSQEPTNKLFWRSHLDKQLDTLVCYDSREEKTTDFADKELRYLISQLSANGAEVVVIIDSSHSGHLHRDREEDNSAIRQTTRQPTPRALEQFIFYHDAKQQGWLNDLSNMPQGQYILLSACGDTELAKEKKINHHINGIFTHALCTQLNSQTNTLHYQNLLMRVRTLTHKINKQQTPQINIISNANINQPFLGSDIVPINMMASFQNKQWELNAGLIHGIHISDEIALRDSAGNDPDFLLLIAQVTQVFTDKSVLSASLNRHKTLLKDLNGLDQINGVYSSSISHRSIDKLTFSLEGDKTGIAFARESLRTLSHTQHKSDFIIEVQHDASTTNIDYRVRAMDGQYNISEADNHQFRPLFEPVTGLAGHYDQSAANEVLRQLEHLKRWHQKLSLENTSSSPQQLDHNAVQLIIKHQQKEYKDEDINLRYNYSKEPFKPRISLEIRYNPDHTKKNITRYCALLLFDATDASVTSLLNNDSKLSPPNNTHIHFKEGQEFPVQVKQQLFNNGIIETEDFLKLIVSDTPFDAKLLTQEGLDLFKGGNKNITTNITHRGANNSLNLLEQELTFSHTRRFERNEEPVIPQWFTKTVKIITTRPPEKITIIPHLATTITPNVHLQAHPTLHAHIRLTTLDDMTRLLDTSQQNTNIIPPIFRDDALTPPFSFSTSRNITSDLAILELHIDPTQHAHSNSIDRVTPKRPLVIKINQPLRKNETILAYSYDGEGYLPLGCSNTQQSNTTKITIERLPTALIAHHDTKETDKGSFLPITILFQKILHNKLDFFQEPTRLAVPLFSKNSTPHKISGYDDNPKTLIATIEKSNNILLILHGIIGNSTSITGFTQRILNNNKSLAQHYDCILTFDYNPLNDPIQKTAERLKQKLATIGLNKHHNKRLDLVAHSIGGLVSRCFIELNQGDKIINTLVMLGTPNGGSQITQSIGIETHSFSNWATHTLAAMMNGYITTGIGALALSSLVKMLTLSGKTLGQMNPNSDVIMQLKKSKQPTTPYHLIIGHTNLLKTNAKETTDVKLMQQMNKKLKLMNDKTLTKWLYNTPNDMSTTIDSIQYLPKKWQSKPKNHFVTCHHLSYFQNEEVLELLGNLLIKK
jgi:triacylglycerol esterase/lipase EstA (alpha/beta hydrolase family)